MNHLHRRAGLDVIPYKKRVMLFLTDAYISSTECADTCLMNHIKFFFLVFISIILLTFILLRNHQLTVGSNP